jgi:hypothetical protein
MAPPQKRTKLKAEEAIGRGTGADSITTCVIKRVRDPEKRAGDDDAENERGLRGVQHAHHDQDRHDRGQRSPEPADIAVAAADSGRDEDGEDREQHPQERVAELVDAQVQRERRVGKQREEAEVLEERAERNAQTERRLVQREEPAGSASVGCGHRATAASSGSRASRERSAWTLSTGTGLWLRT